ncbi:putative quinol monooxygenase [Sandarakinorhabdus sp. AAP62]|uniref:putative quinol monooxygenase n=1 Tax=Sandarakinorhabdus sp. AAP62 TaxID=1248916 RepID=UPI0003806742|nr:putative quinol monooxygenase [Sandarakinorhabdus sp. AAP62]
MILVTGTIRLPADSLSRALPAMAAMVAASRAEPGCLAYSYAQDLFDAGLIHVVERWRDRAALAAHFATPHLAVWRAQFADLGIRERNLVLLEGETEPT